MASRPRTKVVQRAARNGRVRKGISKRATTTRGARRAVPSGASILTKQIRTQNNPASSRNVGSTGRCYSLQARTGRGIGWFATEEIPMGNEIRSEPSCIEFTRNEWDNRPESVVNRLSARERQILENLRGPNLEYGQDWTPINGANAAWQNEDYQNAFNNNRFQIEPYERRVPRYALFSEISKLNHSCVPTAHYTWTPYPEIQDHDGASRGVSGFMTIRACTRISKGEEITIDYLQTRTGLDWPNQRERHDELRHHGFRCRCVICDENLPTFRPSEERRRELSNYIRSVKPGFPNYAYSYRLDFVQQYVHGVESELRGLSSDPRKPLCSFLDDRLAAA